ncbi:MAG: histidine phosphatase family protein [Anaerolineae bacterium]|nr:histidine phosphatase family protein [Anaerolineae bacterium]
MKRILLIRHGQTDWNLEQRWQGHLDVPLNTAGRDQARRLADYLRERSITAVYSSDLTRAVMTAEPIARSHGLDIKPDPRLRELNLGVFQGLTTSEINSKYPEESRQMSLDYLGYVIPTGEARRAMQDRAYAAYRDIVAAETGPEIAVVTHGGTIRVLLLKLFDVDDMMKRISVKNTSVTTIDADGKGARLVEAAATPHLLS